MAKSAPETIILKGTPIMKEAEAGGAITPGQLLIRSGAGTVAVHNSAGGHAAPLFARENDIAGDDIDHAYATGENVLMFVARPGDEVFAFLADGENASVGSFLESNGDGDLRVISGDSAATVARAVVGQALVALDLSGSSAVDPASRRIQVEVM